VIHLNPEAVELLRRQAELHPTGPLFRTEIGTPWRRKALAQRFWRLSKRTGIPVCAYPLRHSYVKHGLLAGVPTAHVAALAGHTSTTMVEKFYGHVGEFAGTLRAGAARIR